MPPEFKQPAADEESPHAHRTVEGDYEERKSIEAQARQERRRARRERLMQYAYTLTEESGGASSFSSLQTQPSRRLIAQNITKRVASKVSLRGSIAVAGTISFWQFVFGFISLLGFILHGMVLQAKEETVMGKIIGFFVDFEKFIPFMYIGYGFWAIATVIGFGSFVGFVLFFYLSGVKMVRSGISLFILLLCLSCTLLPVANLVPTLVLWVAYLNGSSLFRKN